MCTPENVSTSTSSECLPVSSYDSSNTSGTLIIGNANKKETTLLKLANINNYTCFSSVHKEQMSKSFQVEKKCQKR